jgi:hypothetical protein
MASADKSQPIHRRVAWGQLQKTSVQGGRDDRVLFLSNWELGVFMSPATLVNAIRPYVADDKQVSMASYSSLLSSVISVDGDDEIEDSTIILPVPY